MFKGSVIQDSIEHCTKKCILKSSHIKKNNQLFQPTTAEVPLMPRFLVQGIFKVQVDILQLCPRPKVLA